MRVTLLGAGVPTPTPRRFGSAYLLDVASRSSDRLRTGDDLQVHPGRSRTPEVSLLLFTHHHFDHNADYPCFVLTRWDQDVDQTPLRVYGPPPTRLLTRRLFEAPDGAGSATGPRGSSIPEASGSSRIAAGNYRARRR